MVGKLRSNEDHTPTQPAANGDTGPITSSSTTSEGVYQVDPKCSTVADSKTGEVAIDDREAEGSDVLTWDSQRGGEEGDHGEVEEVWGGYEGTGTGTSAACRIQSYRRS